MNKKYVNLGIIGLMIVILVIAGFMDYKKGIDEDIENIDLSNTSETVDNSIVPAENTNTSTTTPNNTVKPAIEAVDTNKAKFNTALSNGSNAFNQKDYTKAINYFNEALGYNKSDVVYVRLFSAYSAQGDWTKALEMINQAIAVNPAYTDYWIYKMVALDEKTTASFAALKAVYDQGITKVDPKTKINLITNFARTAENNGEKGDAIASWTKAIEVYPQNKTIYQTEIDRLNKL